MMRWRDSWLLVLTVTGLVVGIAASLAGRDDVAEVVWTIPTVIVAVRLAWSIVRDLLARKAGVDVIALLAIGGAIALDETFAAALIAVMLATGEALETYAEGRAHRELTALLGRAPQEVGRYQPDGALETVAIAAVSQATDSWCGRARSCRSMAWSAGHRQSSTSRRSRARPAGHPRGGRSRRERGRERRRAVRPDGHRDGRASTYAGIVRLVEEAERTRRRSSDWPTATRSSSCR